MRVPLGAGSPPLARGKPQRARQAAAEPRITPARAGKTFTRRARTTCCRDHPRSRGENTISTPRHHPAAGSPPLARGKRVANGFVAMSSRITPPRAGKTRRARSRFHYVTDHPRSRGENPLRIPVNVSSRGSPPLARGKRTGRGPAEWRMGITPARAGKRDGRPAQVCARRITPARAGKTSVVLCDVVRCGDHPRSRGENDHVDLDRGIADGSPPLARGKPHAWATRVRDPRITPARAGKTAPRASRRTRKRDHPRSRGENGVSTGVSSASAGSPPLARGKHDSPHRHSRGCRITPARARKTM